MQEERHFSFSALRRNVSKSASVILSKLGLLKKHTQKLEEAVSLLSTEQTTYSDSLKTLMDFYGGPDEHKGAFFQLIDGMEPNRIEYFLDQIYAFTGSPQLLVDMREDFLKLRKKSPALMRNLHISFKEYFSKIFNYQYLETRRCDSNTTTIKLLQYIAGKEGVHPAQHWWNFESRLRSPDLIILSLEHFRMPGAPLVYVEIALTKGLAGNIGAIIGPDRKELPDIRKADTAIFYSINSTFAGLGGIGLGRKMIMAAKKYLNKNYPWISNFSTLSPAPKFRLWLESVLSGEKRGFSLTKEAIDANAGRAFFSDKVMEKIRKAGNEEKTAVSSVLKKILADEKWFENARIRNSVREPLEKLALYYLKNEKRKDRKGNNKTDAYDPVENFHLSNGAYIGRLNHCGDISPKGMKNSFGMLVNYVYDAKKMDSNKLKYSEGEIVIKLKSGRG